MAGRQTRPPRSGRGGVALALGLSGGFVVLAVLVTPMVAAAVVIPASIAVGRWRAHRLPTRSPHSLSAPVHSRHAVVNASRVSAATTTNKSVTTAA